MLNWMTATMIVASSAAMMPICRLCMLANLNNLAALEETDLGADRKLFAGDDRRKVFRDCVEHIGFGIFLSATPNELTMLFLEAIVCALFAVNGHEANPFAADKK
jgi:hypothetical protein